ncbi:MAG: chemotaxis protein CheW [Breznakiellaceae bacterium]
MAETHQYLTLSIEGEHYAIPVLKVREVLEYTKITPIPRMAEYLKGIINLRGASVPVIDLRIKFGLPPITPNKETSIIVLDIDTQEGPLILGALADAVHEVIELDPSQIEEVPRFGTGLLMNYVQGVGKKDGEFIIILNMDALFSTEEVVQLVTSQDLQFAQKE